MLGAMTDVSNSGPLTVSVLTGAPVARVAADATLHEVAFLMAASDVGALVLGDGDEPVGIVTERDLVAALDERRDPARTTAGEIASTRLVWCDGDATMPEVAEVMLERYVRHVLVEDEGRLAGIVSARDLLGAYVASDLPTPADPR